MYANISNSILIKFYSEYIPSLSYNLHSKQLQELYHIQQLATVLIIICYYIL